METLIPAQNVPLQFIPDQHDLSGYFKRCTYYSSLLQLNPEQHILWVDFKILSYSFECC